MPRESGRYAIDTKVPASKTRGEIEALLRVNKAERIVTMDDTVELLVGFRMAGRTYKIEVPIDGGMSDQVRRARWRALLLVIKAKLEAVAQRISTIESEFLAAAVMPDGRTVREVMEPQLAMSDERGETPKLLSDYSRPSRVSR